ncbi:fasciclin domain-containing protein [bacterium]|nr:fasciclin domain-containing protein [bacterium]
MRAKLITAFACALPLVVAPPTPAADDKDVVDTAAGSKEHTIFVTAVKEAGLVDELKGKGPFTVFAPTDAAFKKLGDDKIKDVIKNRTLLKTILLAHVVSAKAIYTKDIAGLNDKEVNGFKVAVSGADVKIGDAKVTKADIKASNGVVHVIDTVLIPKK